MNIDIDAHHGDGVQFIFYDDPSVLTVSLHESGRYLFPGTGDINEIGEGEGKGYAVNIPLPRYTSDVCRRKASQSRGCKTLENSQMNEKTKNRKKSRASYETLLYHFSCFLYFLCDIHFFFRHRFSTWTISPACSISIQDLTTCTE